MTTALVVSVTVLPTRRLLTALRLPVPVSRALHTPVGATSVLASFVEAARRQLTRV